MKKCAACGTGPANIGLGSVLLCRDCTPAIQEEMEKLRSAGKPVDVSKIAYRRLQKSGSDFRLRNIPAPLWDRAKHQAINEKSSLNALVMRALDLYLK